MTVIVIVQALAMLAGCAVIAALMARQARAKAPAAAPSMDLAAMFRQAASVDLEAFEAVEKKRAELAEHARIYAETAGVHRRRAKRQEDPAARAENERQAERFERRARIKAAAARAPFVILPPAAAMPRDLRTPAESLSLVDDLRRELADLVATYGDVDAGELDGFRDAVGLTPDALEVPWSTLPALWDCRHLAKLLGWREDGTFRTYRDPVVAGMKSAPRPSVQEEDPPRG